MTSSRTSIPSLTSTFFRSSIKPAFSGELIEVCGPDGVNVVGRVRAEGFVASRANPVDITHECILRAWPRLGQWLEREARNASRLPRAVAGGGRRGWPLTTKQEKPVRELAGRTLQILADWRENAEPTAAWARRCLTTIDFGRASDYLTWSERRDKAQKKFMLWRTRALLVLFGLLVLGLAIASWVFYRPNGEADRAKAVASALTADRQKRLADDRRKDVQTQKHAAETNAEEAALQKDIAEKNAAAALRTARESETRELPAFSNESLIDDLEKIILLGMQAVKATLRFGQPPVAAAGKALHQATLTSQVRMTLRGHSSGVDGVAFSPDGKRLATASWDHTAKVWDVESGKELLTLRGHLSGVYGVAFSPDGKRLATASSDHTAKVWDARSGKELLTLRGHSDSVGGVAYSPDGKHLATASGDHTAKVWDAESGKELLTLRGHLSGVYGVAFCPDGKRLATASDDYTAKVWDVESGKELLALRGHLSGVYGVAFCPDGKRLTTATRAGTVQVYAFDLRELLNLARSRLTRTFTAKDCQRSFQPGTCPPLPQVPRTA